MNYYSILKKQIFNTNDFSIVPIRFEDRISIMHWRNEQMFHLRQNIELTLEEQNNYFENTVNSLFNQIQPNQLLFSFLKKDICIGYGGLVHINWIDQNAEISFIMDTSLEEKHFEEYWGSYISLIQQVAFEELRLHKIYTYAFDLRPHLYPVLEKAAFQEDARLKDHCFFQDEYKDVIIHTKMENEYFSLRKVTLADADVFFEWSNDPLVRKNSFKTEKIEWKNHIQWFESKLNSNSQILILETPTQKIGMIRFDADENHYLLNYSISKEFRGRGFGAMIISLGITTLANFVEKGKEVHAYVKESNIASLKIFRNLKFKESSIDNNHLFTHTI
jgi:RimJ/RimL family protein N-acetyltransferase